MDIERKRKEMHLTNVKGARLGLEVKVLELQAEMDRVKAHLEIQIAKEKELEQELHRG